METRSRKRAEASAPPTHSSASPRPTKRQRYNQSIRNNNNSSSASAMDASGGGESSARGKRNDSASNKGKEKETERRGERSGGGLSMDEDDNESEGVSILHQNLTSASSALQGLLRKLGAGLDDLLPTSMPSSHQSSRLKRILSGLRSEGEEGRQVEALTQLCELLSIGTEESLSTFSVDSFVPLLVSLLNHESNADIMLLAARALTHLCEVLPSSCAAVVHYGAVPCFCARLLTIEYMDLAEQSLQALKKISHEHPIACLRAGALMAVLSYLDFFSTGVQRVALSTAANICKKLPSDAADFVMEAVPLLTNLLHYHDSKVLELASVCLTRIAESFASSPDKLDELCNHGLVAQASRLITVSSSGGAQASLSTPTYTGLIRLLSTCASGSTLATKTLLQLRISGTLKDILAGSGLGSSISVSPALTRPPEQMYEIISLVNELLPPLPQGTISSPSSYGSQSKLSVGRQSHGSNSVKQEETSVSAVDTSDRERLFCEQPELLTQFGVDLFPVLVQVYGSSVNAPVRHKCLSAISKLMYFSPPDMLKALLEATNVSSFLAGVLAWKDPQVLIPALQIAEVLMQKLPDYFAKSFVREGVVHAVETLILPNQSMSSTVPSSIGKDQDNSSGAAPKSRRNRRRGLNNETNITDELRALTTGNGMSPPGPGESFLPNLNSGLRTAVSAHAKRFKDTYFPTDIDAMDVGVTESLCKLKNLCSMLDGNSTDQKNKSKGKGKVNVNAPVSNEEQLQDIVAEILEELSKGDGVSTFEFIGSGVVSSLLNYFSCGNLNKENSSELSKFRHQALRRFKLFIEVSLPSKSDMGKESLMKVIVGKLQNALASVERFPVILSHAPRSTSGNASISAGLSALSQPFKLRLCRAQGEKSLRDYSSNVILIDPLANLAAIEEFLWPRVQKIDSGQKSSLTINTSESGGGQASGAGASSPSASTPASSDRRPHTRSRSSAVAGSSLTKGMDESHASSSRGKGKAVMKCLGDESRGPQTRNAVRRRAASDRDSQMKSAHDNSGSEDDEMDDSPIQIDDALVIDDDDISNDEDDDNDEVFGDDPLPVCLPERVHDVKLGDTMEEDTVASSTGKHASTSSGRKSTSVNRSVESPDSKPGNTLGSKGSLSFAAAAMAGLVSGSGRVGRGGREHYYFHVNGSIEPPRLNFFSSGKQLNRSLTIYQAIQRQAVADGDEDERFNASDYTSGDGRRLWDDVYTITYQRADSQEDKDLSGPTAVGSSRKASSKSGSPSNLTPETTWQQASLLDSILQGNLPCDLEKSNPTYNILLLLRVLEGLNRLTPSLRAEAAMDAFVEGKRTSLDDLRVSGPLVSHDEFISSKLTPKLTRQMQDALALCSGSLPSWCHQLTKACPFLFTFETRRQYFHSTAFGLSRALQRLQQQQNADNPNPANDRELRVGRLQRQKVRVSRSRILDSAAKVMEMYCSQKAVLEVEYFGEVGTGLGPTLEFYTLLSHELQKLSLGMWRTSPDESDDMKVDTKETKNPSQQCEVNKEEFVRAPFGLFPQPYSPNTDSSSGSKFSKVVDYFRLVGRVMAKALQDGRLLDLPLSTAFYKLMLGQELDLYDILSFDPVLGSTLQEMQAIVRRKQYLETLPVDHSKDIADLRFRDARIEDLCLDFTLPGYPDYSLKPDGSETMVTLENLEEYISLVVDAVVKTGILPQMEAFRAGFNQVFPLSTLQIFAAPELDYLLCGRRELWVAEKLVDHIKFDHGYTAKSPPVVNLLQIMGEFTPEQQRAFCRFVTGAPKLPPGGLAVLDPKLTIVRKHPTTGNGGLNGCVSTDAADGDLPSVMTCANYLKLPPYSTKEVMRARLLYAISEGQGSFDLS